MKTVVLDECHHLLDYWAVVLRYLIGRIRGPQVVGLTATLPSPEDGNEYENYTTLLGDVDFESPTPAVVKEGDLAPYRDLAYFTEPTQREMDYLNNVQRAFEAENSRFTRSEALQEWAARAMLGEEKDGKRLEEVLNARPVFSVATLRYLRHAGRAIPGDLLALPLEANEPPTLEDWAALLERYALDHLQTSPREEDHRELAKLRRTLRPFGLSLTERGVRSSRSPGDLVLALSDSKGEAACRILAAELEALGERLRAVVVTDFESMSSGARPEEALDRDAGGARRVLERIVHHRGSSRLDPVLVTGRVVLAADSIGTALVQHFNTRLEKEELRAHCRCEQSKVLGMVQIVGEGADWSPRTYVSLVTDAFEVGLTRCVVGTRGLLGEGWDSPSINVLVDLTSVTTPTSVQQLRGRSIRKDPAWPRKVAHNWDVICVAGGFERGDADLRRFVRRHGRYWGVTPSSPLAGDRGRVVKGISHVDPDLAFGLSVHGFRHTFSIVLRGARCRGWAAERRVTISGASARGTRIPPAGPPASTCGTSEYAPHIPSRSRWRRWCGSSSILRPGLAVVPPRGTATARPVRKRSRHCGDTAGPGGRGGVLLQPALGVPSRQGHARRVPATPSLGTRGTLCSSPCKTQGSSARTFRLGPFAWPRNPTATRSLWRTPRRKTPLSSSVRTARSSRRCATSGT